MDRSFLYLKAVRRLLVAVVLGGALLAGCDTVGSGEVEQQYVVESYLVAGELLPYVRLSRTDRLDGAYEYNRVAVQGADVTIDRLREDGTVEQRYAYVEKRDTAGVYRARQTVRVRPLRTYRLRVEVPETGDVITATTVVPDTFSVVRVDNNPAVYRGGQQVAYTLTKSRYPGRDQAFYIFTTEALEPSENQLTPLSAQLYEDGDVSLESLRLNSSPVLNEASYEANPDGTITVRLPWFAVAFYGPTSVTVSAIDDNLYDFVRSQDAQQGGGAFSPGAIPNVIEHVDGGTGIFGSLVRRSETVDIVRDAEN